MKEHPLHFCQEALPPGERRRNVTCPLGEEALDTLRSEVAALTGSLEAMHTSITAYLAKQENALDGFPLDKDGHPDLSGHRSHHEALIAQAQARTEFWRKMTFELVKVGLLGFLFWAARELWISLINGPGAR